MGTSSNQRGCAWIGKAQPRRFTCSLFVCQIPFALSGLALLLLAVPAHSQTLADQVGGCLGNPPEQTIDADPSSYRSLLPTLGPRDRLLLAAGTYTQGLPIDTLNGQPGRCIVVEGPETGPRAVFTGRPCCNTVSITNSSYVVVRNLELNGLGLAVDAVKAESPSVSAHHITLENLDIHGHGADQQIVGINTKCPAWNWVVRRNVIVGAGTGMYFGDSDGSAEFVASLVEHNLVRDTIGYNMQVKHQNTRSTGLGMPAIAVTVIRHNVFSKAQGYSTGANARPNLLVGHWPLSGAGANDDYLIYGNFFHQNPSEALFQGTGHVALYANLFLNDFGDAVNFQFHEGGSVRNAEVFHNTVVASGDGVRVTGTEASYTQRVRANAVFSPQPISAPGQSDNVTAAYSAAGGYLTSPTAPAGAGLSLFPLPGTLTGSPADLAGLEAFLDYDRDFNGTAFDPAFRGAYSGEGANPGWALALERKPEPPSPPSPPADFFPLAPCRVADTRLPANQLPPGPFGGPGLIAGQGRTFDLAGRCGIPSSARAVSLNLTVTQPTLAGNLRLYPAGTSLPPVSSLNYAAGQTRGNNALVRLSSTAGLAIHCTQASGTAHVIIDVNGYFE